MKSFFKDDSGYLSFMRLCSFIALIVAILMSWYAIVFHTEKESFTIILTWVIAAFAPKTIQKFAERISKDILPSKK